MDGGAWKAAIHGVAEGRTRLSDFTFTFGYQQARPSQDFRSGTTGLPSIPDGLPWVALVVKNLPANADDLRDSGSIPRLGRSPEGGHGKQLR